MSYDEVCLRFLRKLLLFVSFSSMQFDNRDHNSDRKEEGRKNEFNFGGLSKKLCKQFFLDCFQFHFEF